MNFESALKQLEALKTIYKGQLDGTCTPDMLDRACILYGQLEELIMRLVPKQSIKVQTHGDHYAIYNNLIAAGLLASRSFYIHDGYRQLLSLIGKVEQLVNDPGVPLMQHSVVGLLQGLRRFRECCQYHKEELKDEKSVQDILWIMLRSQYDIVDREAMLPKFGVKNYRPDFGMPELRVLIEAKYIGSATAIGNIQDEVIGDIPGYLNAQSSYDGAIIFVYDAASKLRDAARFIEDIKSVKGVIDVIVIPAL